MNRTLNVSTPLGAEVLRFDSLQGRESLSQLFDFQLTMKSEEKGIPAQSLLGQPVTVDVELDGGGRRYLSGAGNTQGSTTVSGIAGPVTIDGR